MDIYEVIEKLIGPIIPIGETNEDNKRLENLKSLTKLTDKLVYAIDNVAYYRHSEMYSKKRAGKHASEFLDKLGIEE